MKYQSGITLIETMATLAILAVLTAVAMPSFKFVIKNNRIATQTNNLVSALHYARGETVTRGVSVQVEPVVAGTNWSRGWLVRIDDDNSNAFESTDTVLRNFEGLRNATLTSSQDTVIFNPAGDAAAAVTLTLKATECNGDFKRIINVKLSGLISISDDKSC